LRQRICAAQVKWWLVSFRRLFSGGTLCALLFLALGSAFVPRAGIEEDEAMFAAPLYRDWCFYSIPLTHGRIPIMHMTYVGALKTWIYAPVAAVWPPDAAMLRLPAVLLGSLTILMFWMLLDSAYGRRAAWAGCVLLTTDAVFLLTTTFDWGPVALQHLLVTAALLFALWWARTGRDAWLAAAAFCCGLAFWDKAVFAWMFTGLCAGSLVFFPLIRRRFSWRRCALIAAALCLGASPLIYYNLASSPKFPTIRSNAQFTTNEFGQRVEILRRTWKGSGLFELAHDSADRPNPPRGPMERASFALHDLTGDHWQSLQEPALLAALLLLPFLRRTAARKGMLFAFIAAAIAWTTMISFGGGSSVHHSVLLWPLPQLFLGVAYAEVSGRLRLGKWALTAAVALLTVTNLLVINQYLFLLTRNGAAGRWTDAIYPLAAELRAQHPTQLALVDWGTQDPLTFLNQDHPSERVVDDPFLPPGEPEAQKKFDLDLLADGGAIWVEYTPGNEITPGINDRLLQSARGAGFEPVPLEIFNDRNGRPIFQTLRFVARH